MILREARKADTIRSPVRKRRVWQSKKQSKPPLGGDTNQTPCVYQTNWTPVWQCPIVSPLTGLNKICFMIPGAYASGYPSSGPIGLIRHISLDTLLVPAKSIALRYLKLDTTLVSMPFMKKPLLRWDEKGLLTCLHSYLSSSPGLIPQELAPDILMGSVAVASQGLSLHHSW